MHHKFVNLLKIVRLEVMAMPKFFVTSDIHSFMNPLKRALDEKGFDPTNKDHWLVVCGDC